MFRIKYLERRIRILTKPDSTEINESMSFYAIFMELLHLEKQASIKSWYRFNFLYEEESVIYRVAS